MNMDSKVKEMQKVRRGLKDQDMLKDLDMNLDDAFFDRLHDKVMAQIEETEMAPAPTPMISYLTRRRVYQYWKDWSYPAGGLAAVFVLAFALVPQMQKINESMTRAGLVTDGTERIIQQALGAPEEISQTFISTQSEADFFIDVARESFENLPSNKIEKLILGESTR